MNATLFALALVLAATTLSFDAAAAGDEPVIGVIPGGYESRFSPDRLEVDAGQEVLFQANGTFGHNLRGVDADFSAGDLSPGEESTFTAPREPGEYAFECRFHKDAGMVGVLVVREGAASPSPPAGATPPPETGGEEESTVPGVGPVAVLAVALLAAAGWRRLRA